MGSTFLTKHATHMPPLSAGCLPSFASLRCLHLVPNRVRLPPTESHRTDLPRRLGIRRQLPADRRHPPAEDLVSKMVRSDNGVTGHRRPAGIRPAPHRQLHRPRRQFDNQPNLRRPNLRPTVVSQPRHPRRNRHLGTAELAAV